MKKFYLYYRRDGTPYKGKNAVLKWAKDSGDWSLRRVAETTLADGKWISTVWLGLNHLISEARPLIFETMVFPKRGNFLDLDMNRYSTEVEAIAGHKKMVRKWKRKIVKKKKK